MCIISAHSCVASALRHTHDVNLDTQAGTPYDTSREGTQYVLGLSTSARSNNPRMAAWAVSSTSLIAQVPLTSLIYFELNISAYFVHPYLC